MTENMFQLDGPLEGVLGQVSVQLREILVPLQRGLGGQPDSRPLLHQSYFRLLRLAQNLSALEEGGQGLFDSDVVGLCRTVMEQAEYPAELLGLRLDFRCGKNAHILAMDAPRLERLLWNLLSNAFQFTPRGGTVSLEVRVEKEVVQLTVADTGCGIGPDALETAFHRPRRLDPFRGGLGLGLPICRRIAQEHGGSLILTSRDGGGTMAAVSLPNRRAGVRETGAYTVRLDGGYSRALVELADVLPGQAFEQKFLD